MKMISFTLLCLCVQQVLNTNIENGHSIRESRKLFGGYRITPKFCKPTRDTGVDSKGPNICMFNHECTQRNGLVVGACMDGFLFGTCCQLPEGVASELSESDLHSPSNPDNIIFQPTEQPISTNMMPVLGQITSSGVSQITNTLLGILPTAQDNAVVQVDEENFSTSGITHPTAPDTVLQNANNEIDPSDFRPTHERETTVRADSTTSSSIPSLFPSSTKPTYLPTNSIYVRPIFRPKPQKPNNENYVLVPTISHETKPNKSQEVESIVNILHMLNGSSTLLYPSSTESYLSGPSSISPVYIFNTAKPQFTRKPPSTSYVFSTTLPPRPTYSPDKKDKPSTSSTKFTSSSNLIQMSTKQPLYSSGTSERPSQSTYGSNSASYLNTKKPPSTSYLYSSTLSKRPATSTPSPTYSSKPSSPTYDVFPSLPNVTPTVIVLSPVTEDYPIATPNNNIKPNIPQRKPITQVTINNHITHNVYSSSERPAPTVLITPKPSSTIPPLHAITESDVVVEEQTSPNDLHDFPPVRNPNLNMSIPLIFEDDVTTPEFVEDAALKNKVETFVNKIIMGLQEPLNGLQDFVLSDNNTQPFNTVNGTTKKPSKKTSTTRKPAGKPTQGLKPSPKPTPYKATTKKPSTSVTKKPSTTTPNRKPTKKPGVTTTSTEQQTIGSINQDYKQVCGRRPLAKTGRIVGGKGATFGEFPWQVLVRESTWLGLFTKNKCGGVLISNRYVMTAAHCQPGFLASLVAVFGENDISGDIESRRSLSRNIKRVILHRKYDPATFANDLALLELEHPIQFDQHIIPICLPKEGEDFTGRMATVTGWGRLRYGGPVPSTLQEVQVPIMENHLCQEMFKTAGHTKIILESFLCAGYANGQKDSCEGDSGGPLVLQRTDGRYQLAGTVSHGIKCAAPYLPGVYMRTAYYKPWIEGITGIH